MTGGGPRHREIQVPAEQDLVTVKRDAMVMDGLGACPRAVESFLIRLPFSDARLEPSLETPGGSFLPNLPRKGPVSSIMPLCSFQQLFAEIATSRECVCDVLSLAAALHTLNAVDTSDHRPRRRPLAHPISAVPDIPRRMP